MNNSSCRGENDIKALWLNADVCPEPVNATCPPGAESNVTESCLCESTCSLLGSFSCAGTPLFLFEPRGSFISLRSVSVLFIVPFLVSVPKGFLIEKSEVNVELYGKDAVVNLKFVKKSKLMFKF